jgi:membrane-associated phospholipid phosphatase
LLKQESVNPILVSNQKNQFTFSLYSWFVLALILCALITKKGDDVLFINGMHTPLLDGLARAVTNFGDGLIFLPVFIGTLFIRFRFTIAAALICLISGVVSSLFKKILFADMLRPKNIISNDLLYFVPGVDVHGVHSFPSGHTTTAFCAAIFLALVTRNQIVGFICLVCALLVGWSRIYLVQHFLIDVAAGALLGTTVTIVTWQLMENIPGKEWMNRRIRFNKERQKRSPRPV